jgi:fructose-1,6-bisphosphatase
MPYRRKTFSKFIIEHQRRSADPQPELTSLLNDIQTSCKLIGLAAARGRRDCGDAGQTWDKPPGTNAEGDEQKPLDLLANAIMVGTCEFGGQLAAMVSEEMEEPYEVPAHFPRGRLLLVFDSLDGSSDIDVNVPVGTIFSVLKCPEGATTPIAQDFMQPGAAQVAAGYAIYGPTTMLVVTLGDGVHGFTLDRDTGAFVLTHADMRIPEATCEFAVNISNQRFWEPPVRRYIEECIEGAAGPRGVDFNMRWIASLVAEVHRILLRGGVFMYPRDEKRLGRLRLLYEASPMAMIVEQAGGAASTGRERLLGIVPSDIHQRVAVILGSRVEVERLDRYHLEHARGDGAAAFDPPLFQVRSLFRTAS